MNLLIVQDSFPVGSDLQGYFSDGFIRPDEEIVYTTSASDCSVEQDLENLRRPIPMFSCEGSQPAGDGFEFQAGGIDSGDDIQLDEADYEVQRASIPQNDAGELQTDIFSQIGSDNDTSQIDQTVQPLPPSRSKKSKMDLELEKELASLQPFYYDR